MEQSEVPQSGPAGAWLAVGSVVAIAVVVVTGVVLWARLAEGQGGERAGPPTLDEPVPTELAGGYEPGDVPEAVRDGRGEPVVGARLLDELPPGVGDCDFPDLRWEEEPEVEVALLTPDGLFTSLVGAATAEFDRPGETQQWRTACSHGWDGQSWTGSSGGSIGPADDGHFDDGFGSGFSCCDRRGLATATADVAVPDGAAWALQERSEWWLAYPVQGRPRLTLTWKFDQPRFDRGRGVPTRVVFVDAEGREIAEQWAGG